jgi:peptide deformylase
VTVWRREAEVAAREIMQLGNPALYEPSEPVREEELETVRAVVQDLHDTVLEFRKKYGYGRAIAAPQIGFNKRLVYMFADGKSTVFINPVLDEKSDEMVEIWDDCMSFPDLRVRILRHRSCRIRYRNAEWGEEELRLEGDLSELLQHECDHLDGILAVSRAIDGQSFALSSQSGYLQR